MIQEQKDLLLKDLCARLPYNVKVYDNNGNFNTSYVNLLHINGKVSEAFVGNGMQCRTAPIDEIRPYLFPLSSMTEEQINEYYSLADDVTIKPGQGSYFGIKIHCIKLGISDNPHEGVWDDVDLDAIDWLNKNHFDYRGLIPMGLANDATGLNIY